jgi:hypothetical protein
MLSLFHRDGKKEICLEATISDRYNNAVPFMDFSEGGLGETALSLPLLGEGGP